MKHASLEPLLVDVKMVLGQVQRVCRESGNNPHIVSLNPFTLEDVLDDILTVGVATGTQRWPEA